MYNDADGICDFEEAEISRIVHSREQFDGSMDLYDNHGQDVMDNTSANMFGKE